MSDLQLHPIQLAHVDESCLMVGSEGTLGIFTRITLRLVPQPAARAVLLVPFGDVPTAIAAVPRVMTEGHLVPASVEFMDQLSVQTAYDFIGESPPQSKIGAMLLIEVDGYDQEQVEREMENILVEVRDASGKWMKESDV